MSEPGRIRFPVRLVPRAGRSGIGGERGGALLVRVAAPPLQGRANAALLALLADELGIAPGSLRLERGARSRDKVVSAPEACRGRLAALRERGRAAGA